MGKSWAWNPPKGTPKPAKLPDAPIRVQGSPRSVVPHFERTTERCETGGWGRGPGNNVSDTMRGHNGAEDKMLARFGAHSKALRQKRRAARVARLAAMGR